MFVRILSTLVCLVCLTAMTHADNPPQYLARQIGLEVNPDSALSAINAMNEQGDAAGVVDVTDELGTLMSHALLYTFEHGPVLLPQVGSLENARATDISDRDLSGYVIISGVAGFNPFLPTQPDGVGVYWIYSTTSGQVIESGQVGPLPGDAISWANGVNNAGKIVGFSRLNDQLFSTVTPIVFDVNTQIISPIIFPTIPVDINNNDEIAGGQYVGDLEGNSTDLGFPPQTSTVDISAINDHGWVSARIVRTFTDGNGFFVNGAARFTTEWEILWSISRFDNAKDINENGDVVGDRATAASVYFDDLNQVFTIGSLIESNARGGGPLVGVGAINTNRQIGLGVPAEYLSPLEPLIIPGDVNGDADVNPSDLCDWLAAPIDLDGDGDVDNADETWLIDRLESLGFPTNDCNANGVPDPCDILNDFSSDCNNNSVPDECDPDCDADGLPDDCESDCNDNGVPDSCDIADGTSDDCNGNGIPDECDVSDTVTGGQTYDPMLPIEQNTTVTDTVFIQDSGTIADVNFSLDIDYRISSLTVRLHHAGQTVTLINQPGPDPFGFDNLGYRVELDDEGDGPNIQSVGSTTGQFEPVESPPAYVPANLLSAFDGLPREGVWELELVLDFPQQAVDAGLFAWSVEVTDTGVDPGECTCPADIDDSGVVGLGDLLMVLSNWGGMDGDVNGDGTTGLSDLLQVLSAWGLCE